MECIKLFSCQNPFFHAAMQIDFLIVFLRDRESVQNSARARSSQRAAPDWRTWTAGHVQLPASTRAEGQAVFYRLSSP